MHPNQNHESRRPARILKHVSTPSYGSDASGFSDSSNGESRWLSQFPSPPFSIPTTPVSPGFSIPSLEGEDSSVYNTLHTRHKESTAPLLGGSSSDTNLTITQVTPTYSAPLRSHQPRTSHKPSPHDWHDGASSITMDNTEDRLLPTSFITSLLQENVATRSAERGSPNGDAFSGFSEVSYPPLASGSRDIRVQLSPPKTSMLRQPGRRLLSACTPVLESPNRLSEDSGRDYTVKATSFSDVLHLKKDSAVHATHVLPPSASAKKCLDGYLQGDVDSYKDTRILPLGHGFPPGTSSEESPRQHSRTAQGRESLYSTRSLVPSWISRISTSRSVRRVMTWRSVRPLPLIPILHHTPKVETEGRGADESQSPDPVSHPGIVDHSHHSHRRRSSRFVVLNKEETSPGFDDSSTMGRRMTSVQPKRSPKLWRWFGDRRPRSFCPMMKRNLLAQHKKRTLVILGVVLLVIFVVVGTTLGIVTRRTASHACLTGFAGAGCDLNATCVCTSTLSGRCDGLAQNILELIPTLNQRFVTNMTSNMVYNGIWLAQGDVPGSNCASQSLLVDVAPAINSRTLPNVTQWAQTALLWNLIESQDIQATKKLQDFIQKAPWTLFSQSVQPSFSVLVSGYMFNFVTQEVTPPNVPFVTQSQPPSAQLAQVGPVAHSALDRIYSFAVASSTQHQKALANYWTAVLQQRPADLPVFMSALTASPILLPFDATPSQQTVATLLTVPAPSSFPPPLGCYPGLSPAQKVQIDSIEGPVFGLMPLLNATQFEPACYPDRPVYGVLDILRLRLPFIDSGTHAKQAAVLKRDIVPRVSVHSGEVLSSLLGASDITAISEVQSDPRQYGTLGHFDHVVLRYLSSISDVNVATALVNYILGSTILPPTDSSILYRSLAVIPVMEVVVFGSIAPSDIDSVVSAFTTTSGSLFFGSDQGGALRNWAITGCSSMIVWSETALSPLVVHDRDLSDPIFNQTWTAVSTALHYNITGIGIANITETFGLTHKFTP